MSLAEEKGARLGQPEERLFELAGTRSTLGEHNLDRHWRNARTHTLHDPVDYKLRELGDWVLNERHPNPSFYS